MVQFGEVVEGLPDPENDAVETLTFDGSGSKNVTLEEGDYEIWTEEEDDFGPGEEDIVGSLEVTDEEGNSVFERDEGETITIDKPGSGERAYEKVGNLNISESGEYTFETDERCILYVTESEPFFDSFTSILTWILVIGGSATIAIIGGLLLFLSWFNKKECPYCGETISEDSLRCKHCNRDLTQGAGTYDSRTRNQYQLDTSQRQPPPSEDDRPGQERER